MIVVVVVPVCVFCSALLVPEALVLLLTSAGTTVDGRLLSDATTLEELPGLEFEVIPDGTLEGTLDGALDGALDGTLDGTLDGALEGVLDDALEGALDDEGVLAGIGSATVKVAFC